jgi:DNA repair exonuclease SbcCD ATPase subunit
LSEYNQKSKDLTELNKAIKRAELDQSREIKHLQSLEKELDALQNHKCHACGQEYHDGNHDQLVETKIEEISNSKNLDSEHSESINTLNSALEELGALGAPPKVYYDRESDAFEHRSSMASLLNQISSKQAETDPYGDQIEEMIDKGLESINYDQINELISLKDHQEFLLKLLTNKDSFVRKKIIDQNLSYLNARLEQYLDRIGLPHTVQFNNDLSVSITELGRELDFHNLSRGEMTRLTLSLSFAFRDVWENLFHPINLLFIDELLDNGLDPVGMENALSILKGMGRERNKSVWFISHRDELIGRVSNVLKVVKENGYTEFRAYE